MLNPFGFQPHQLFHTVNKIAIFQAVNSREVLQKTMHTPKTSTFARDHLRSLTLSVACILFAASLLPAGASAQEFRGTISGTVTDSSGAIIKDAQVTITETSTGTINRTKTDSAGQYVVPFLQPGTYQIVDNVSRFAGRTNMEKPPRTTIFCRRIDGL